MQSILRVLLSLMCYLSAVFSQEIVLRLGAGLNMWGSSEETQVALKALLQYASGPVAAILFLLGTALLVSPWVTSFVIRKKIFSPTGSDSDRGFLVALFVACMAAGFAVNGLVFDDYKITPDENTFLAQARFFARGDLYGEAPPVPESFEEPYLAHEGGRLFSVYQPGWSLLLAPGVALGVERAIPPLTAAFSLLVVFFLGRKLFGRPVARGAPLIMLFSPYFLFYSGTYYSHIAGLLWVCLFALCFVTAREEGRRSFYLIAGICLAAGFLTRYFDLVFGLPFGTLLLWDLLRRREGALRNMLFFGSPILLAGCLAIGYQWILTGDPFRSAYAVYIGKARYIYILSKLENPFRVYGFSSVYPPSVGALRMVMRWCSLNVWIFPLALLFLLPALGRIGKWEILILLGCLALSLAYVPYFPPGGLEYGPRYYFPMFGCLALVIARGVEASFLFIRKKWGEGRIFRGLANWLFLCLTVNLCLCLTVGAVMRLVVRGATDLNRVVAEKGVREGVVLLTIRPDFFAPGEIDETHPQECKDMPYYMIRNQGDYRQPLLFAHSLGEAEDRRLMEHFPDRKFYVYRADPFAAALGLGSGELEELSPGNCAGQGTAEGPPENASDAGGKGRFSK